MTSSDVPQVGLRQLSDNFQVLCPSALLPICAAGRFRRLMTRDVLAVQGVHIRCFPPISKRTWSLPISCRWPTWSLLISYPNLLVGHLLAISENIPRLVHPIFYAEWVAVMMILISECCHNEFGRRSISKWFFLHYFNLLCVWKPPSTIVNSASRLRAVWWP